MIDGKNFTGEWVQVRIGSDGEIEVRWPDMHMGKYPCETACLIWFAPTNIQAYVQRCTRHSWFESRWEMKDGKLETVYEYRKRDWHYRLLILQRGRYE